MCGGVLMDTMSVNGKAFAVIKLLGKGKGGYSYLVSDREHNYVLKQIHHEPCSYYTLHSLSLSFYYPPIYLKLHQPTLCQTENTIMF